MIRSRTRSRFRILAVALVTLMQLPAVAWLCARAHSPWPIAVAIALSFPYLRRLRTPWQLEGHPVPMYLAQRPSVPAKLAAQPGVNGPPIVVPGTELGNNGTVFNYCYAMMRLEGPKMTVDYYQVNSTDARPGNPPPLGKPLYCESLEAGSRE